MARKSGVSGLPDEIGRPRGKFEMEASYAEIDSGISDKRKLTGGTDNSAPRFGIGSKIVETEFLLVDGGRSQKGGFHSAEEPLGHRRSIVADLTDGFSFMVRALCLTISKRYVSENLLIFFQRESSVDFSVTETGPTRI